nr:MAG TPA: Minor capsid protein [Caudoviricetes sp.]
MRIETPRGSIVRSRSGNARLVWNPEFQPNREVQFERVQEYVDSEVLRLSMPYIPRQSGMLQKSGQLGTVIGSGEVIYNAPYSRYQYYGKVMVGRAPKRLTDRDLTYQGAPKRAALWFERMKADKLDKILKGAQRLIERGMS